MRRDRWTSFSRHRRGGSAARSRARSHVAGLRTGLKPLGRQIVRQKFGLRHDLTTWLVMGGSQGASGINQAMIKSLPFLQGASLQLIHLSGARDERLVAVNYHRENVPAYVAAF